MKKKIELLLYKVLLEGGSMEFSLYIHDLEEHKDYWKDAMHKDNDEFVFVITENRGYAAMLLITNKDEIFINEEARARLQQYWQDAYKSNIQQLIPSMTQQLADGIFPVNGVKFIE